MNKSNVNDLLLELNIFNNNPYEDNKIKLLERINNNFNKKELQDMLSNVNMISSLLNSRISMLKDENPIVTIAYVSTKKEGNKKFISFGVCNCILLKDTLGSIEYKSTGFKKDILVRDTFNYKKSDKQSIKTINEFKNNIVEQFDVYNIAEFEKDFNSAIEGKEVK